MSRRPAATVLAFAVLALTVLAIIGCERDDRQPVGPSFQTNEWCDTHPIECNGNTDPDPAAPGYYLGSTISAWSCFSPTGVGITDFDKDGMHDQCESSLAYAFRPSLSLAPASYDCDPTGEPYWAAKYFPSKGYVVRIAYLFAYHFDCGSGSIASKLLGSLLKIVTLNGVINAFAQNFDLQISVDDPGEGHTGDSEFALVDVRFDPVTQHWSLVRAKLSAHYGTPVDGTATVSASGVQHADLNPAGYPTIWVARNKHANYTSRSSCNAGRGPGGVAKDNCDANRPNVERLQFVFTRNIGSLRQNAFNLGSCVYSAQPAFYPGRECFWEKGNDFMGWARYPVGHPTTPYYSLLVTEFECYGYTGTSTRACSDFGVVRN